MTHHELDEIHSAEAAALHLLENAKNEGNATIQRARERALGIVDARRREAADCVLRMEHEAEEIARERSGQIREEAEKKIEFMRKQRPRYIPEAVRFIVDTITGETDATTLEDEEGDRRGA